MPSIWPSTFLHTHAQTRESRLAAGRSMLDKKTPFLETQNIKILVDSEKLAAWTLITFMVMDSLT